METSGSAVPRSLGRRLRFSQLELVHAVMEAGSLGVAAERLHLTRAAVSKAIKELERSLGQVLFVRSSNGMVATAVGQRVARHAELMVNELRHLTEEISSGTPQAAGPLRLGMPAFVAEHVAPDILKRLCEPGTLRVHVHEGRLASLIEQLLKGEIDAALALYAPRAVDAMDLSMLQVQPFVEAPIVVVAAPGLRLPKGKVRWEDLSRQPWVLPPAGTHLRRSVDEMFTSAGCPVPQEVILSGALAANVRFAAAGLGLAPVPLPAAQAQIDAGHLRIVDVRPVLPPTHVALMYRKVSAIYLDVLRRLEEAVRA